MKWMFMPLRRYADFNGRSRRMEYWMWALFNLIVGLLLAVPLFIITYNAFRTVEQNGGVRYHTDYSTSPTDRFDTDTPRTDSPSDVRSDEGNAKPKADDWSANPGPDSSNDQGVGSDNGSSENGDKVSSRTTTPAADGGILAYSVSYRGSVDINPLMFMRAFGPLGWTLFSLYCIWGLITFIPNLAVAIRRLHDTDRSGWWILISMVPLVGAIVLLVFLLTEGTRGPNRFGPDPKAAPVDTTFA